MTNFDPNFGGDQLLTTQDLLPRSQLQNALRGGTTEAQPIEQLIRQTFAYMVGFQPATTPNGLVVPTLLRADSSGNLGVLVENNSLQTLFTASAGYGVYTQTVTNGVNELVIPAPGANMYNIFYGIWASVYGSGVMPTAATPLKFNWTEVSAGGYLQVHIIGAGITELLTPNNAGAYASTNVADTIHIDSGGANVTTDLNVLTAAFAIPY